MDLSVVEYYGEQNRGTCGYCKGTKSSFSHGMHAYMMSTQDYQDLIDRGWRRSGEYCYKPNNRITCCPSYTIKCDSGDFKLSKSQKKVLKRMNKFLRDGIKEKDNVNEEKSLEAKVEEFSDGPREIIDIPNRAKQVINSDEIANISRQVNATCDIASKRFKCYKNEMKPNASNDEKNVAELSTENTKKQCKKAKQMRLEKKKAKFEANGLPFVLNQNKNKANEKTLSDFINETSENDRHKLKIKLLESKSRECLSNLKETYALYEKYQTIIHNDPPESLKEFLRFLQKSPIKHYKPADGPPEGYGSFHQQYWLDDKLIAVGVIDILPKCLSSVYFFYDPDYSFLSLGTYGSLREIDLVIKLCEKIPSLRYYYMGFYIHSCPKMKYKGKLTGSYLLCPEKYSWHLLTDEIRTELNAKKYQVFNTDPNTKDEEEFTQDNVKDVLVLFERNSYITYSEFKRIKRKNFDKEIFEYGSLVGKSCAHRMLFLAFS